MLEQAVRNNDIAAAQTAVEKLAALDPREEFFRDGSALFLYGENSVGARTLAEHGLSLFPDSADLTIVVAESLLMEQRDAEAITLLKEYLKKHPHNLSVRTRLAEIFIQFQRFPEAERLLAQIPGSKRTPYIRLLQAKILVGLDRSSAAESLLRDIIKTSPAFLEAWAELAFVLESRQEYARALKIYEMLLAQDAENISLWNRIVALTLKLNDPTKALNIVRQGPTASPFRINAATSFMEEGFPAEAEDILSELQRTSNATDEGAYYLALALVENRNAYSEALAVLKDIVPDSPLYQRVVLLRAQLLAESGQADQALPLIRALRQEYPELPELWKMEAQCLGLLGRNEEAVRLLDEAITKWPQDMDLRFTFGVELDRQNRKDDALSVMEYILTCTPDNPHALNYVGYTLAEQNRSLNRALHLIQRALSIYPNSYHIIDSLAWVYYQQKNYMAAWEAIRKALSLNSQESTLWEHYGDIARAMGKKGEAKKGYAKALELGADNPDEVALRLQELQRFGK